MKDINEQLDLNELIAKSNFLIVQYGKDTCTPCASVRAKITEWVEKSPGIDAYYIDVAQFPKLSAQRGIFSVPSVEVYIQGKLSIQESGYFSLEEIFEQIERYKEIQA